MVRRKGVSDEELIIKIFDMRDRACKFAGESRGGSLEQIHQNGFYRRKKCVKKHSTYIIIEKARKFAGGERV